MDIVSLSQLKYGQISKSFSILEPKLAYISTDILDYYIVQKGEEMRIDLVMMSIYEDSSTLKDIDVILFVNNIDNPLNICVDDVIYYPPYESLSSYRYIIETSSRAGESVRAKLATPNKTTVKDPARKKFVDNGYSLPPVVLDEAKAPVRLENGKIVMGGLN